MSALVFVAALIAPLLYAFCNHIDKILLDGYFKEGGVGTLILFSSLLSLMSLPIVYLIDPTVLQIGFAEFGILAFVGLLNVGLLWAYLQSMADDEPTVVIIFYQMVPVFGLILGNIILGETITSMQAIAMVLIMVGSIIMTIATDADGKIVFRFKTIALMAIASLCWAGESTLFKMVALEENVFKSLFWENFAVVAIGIVIFITVSHYRHSFLKAFKVNSKPILGLNVLNESLYMVGNASASFVVVLIPVALNLLMNSFQPIFVFVIGIVLSWLLPGTATENALNRLPQKIIAIALTGVGAYLLGGVA